MILSNFLSSAPEADSTLLMSHRILDAETNHFRNPCSKNWFWSFYWQYYSLGVHIEQYYSLESHPWRAYLTVRVSWTSQRFCKFELNSLNNINLHYIGKFFFLFSEYFLSEYFHLWVMKMYAMSVLPLYFTCSLYKLFILSFFFPLM